MKTFTQFLQEVNDRAGRRDDYDGPHPRYNPHDYPGFGTEKRHDMYGMSVNKTPNAKDDPEEFGIQIQNHKVALQQEYGKLKERMANIEKDLASIAELEKQHAVGNL